MPYSGVRSRTRLQPGAAAISIAPASVEMATAPMLIQYGGVKRAIVIISETYRGMGMRSRVALDMHDALILEVAHDEWDEAISLASTVMTNPVAATNW